MTDKTNNVLAFTRPVHQHRKILSFKKPDDLDELSPERGPVKIAPGPVVDQKLRNETPESCREADDRQAVERGEDEGMIVGQE